MVPLQDPYMSTWTLSDCCEKNEQGTCASCQSRLRVFCISCPLDPKTLNRYTLNKKASPTLNPKFQTQHPTPLNNKMLLKVDVTQMFCSSVHA